MLKMLFVICIRCSLVVVIYVGIYLCCYSSLLPPPLLLLLSSMSFGVSWRVGVLVDWMVFVAFCGNTASEKGEIKAQIVYRFGCRSGGLVS